MSQLWVVCCIISTNCLCECFFFFQAEDGIRDAQESRGLGDVYKRQLVRPFLRKMGEVYADRESLSKPVVAVFFLILLLLSLIHI